MKLADSEALLLAAWRKYLFLAFLMPVTMLYVKSLKTLRQYYIWAKLKHIAAAVVIYSFIRATPDCKTIFICATNLYIR